MSSAIADLLTHAVENVEADSGLARRVIRRSRHRMRIYAVTGTLLVAVAAVCSSVAVQQQGHDQAVISVRPPAATASAAPLVSVNGVDVVWAPAGFTVSPLLRLGAQTDHRSVDGTFTRRFDEVVGKMEMVGSESVALSVRRSYTADLDALAQSGSSTFVTVRGHRAVLQQGSQQQPAGSTRYLLTWAEAPGLTLSVEAEGRLKAADVEEFAQRLVVHAAPALPGNPSAAQASVRAALDAAFTGGQPAATTLHGIQNGEQLAPVLAELSRVHPDVENSARVSINSITFVDSARAIAEVVINYQENGAQTYPTQTNVLLVDGSWKVSQASYCDTVQLLVTACPS
jgi:hypothetical protein